MERTRCWVVLFLIATLWGVSAFSQEAPDSKDRLYSMALAAAADQMHKQWGYIDDSDRGSRIRTDYHHLIVRKNPEITDDLPSQSDEFHFEYLDDAELLARFNKSRKQFSFLEVHPIHDRSSILKVHIAQNWVESRRGRLIIAISDWADIEFRYDCQEQAFMISDVKLGGI